MEITMKITRRALIRLMVYSTIAVAGGAGYVFSKQLEVLRQDLSLPGWPRSLNGLKIGMMADFHAGSFTTRADIQHAADVLMMERPDIIALLGDYVDGFYSHHASNVDKGSYVFDILKELKAPLGVYAVLGNHDHWTDRDRVMKELTKLPLRVLNNERVTLASKLVVAGVDDWWEGPSDAQKALVNLNPESFVLMLSHNPDVNLELRDDQQVRLVLSGHTHGGQIRVPYFNIAPWVPCMPAYRGRAGLIRESETRWTFITKGVGTFCIPVRLACPPDVGIVHLRRT